MLSVLVEKEQVALLATEAEQFLDRIADEHPEEPGTFGELAGGGAVEEDEPLFRARLIGIGFDPERSLVLLELREQAADDDEAAARGRGERRSRRAALRDARADPRDARQRRRRGLRGPAQVPAVRLPDGSRRAHLPADELNAPREREPTSRAGPSSGRSTTTPRAPCCATARSRCSAGCRGRRTRRSSCRLSIGADQLLAIYKPQRGERPLWDFPRGTLCNREVAAREVSEALGWAIVPDTVLRDGPVGLGMMQRFVHHDPEEHYFTLLAEHGDEFRRMAAFDIVINNTDRKGGHCLRATDDGSIFGIDHGVSFHAQWKLRTVIWDFACEPIPPDVCADLHRLDRRPARRPRRAPRAAARPLRARRDAGPARAPAGDRRVPRRRPRLPLLPLAHHLTRRASTTHRAGGTHTRPPRVRRVFGWASDGTGGPSMTAAWMWGRSELRARWRSWVMLGLLAGATFGLAAAGWAGRAPHVGRAAPLHRGAARARAPRSSPTIRSRSARRSERRSPRSPRSRRRIRS